jgi:hypothetical protein
MAGVRMLLLAPITVGKAAARWGLTQPNIMPETAASIKARRVEIQLRVKIRTVGTLVLMGIRNTVAEMKATAGTKV